MLYGEFEPRSGLANRLTAAVKRNHYTFLTGTFRCKRAHAPLV